MSAVLALSEACASTLAHASCNVGSLLGRPHKAVHPITRGNESRGRSVLAVSIIQVARTLQHPSGLAGVSLVSASRPKLPLAIAKNDHHMITGRLESGVHSCTTAMRAAR